MLHELADARELMMAGDSYRRRVRLQRASLVRVAHDRAAYGEVWDLAEALIEHDSLMARWRARHVLMVQREIATKSGTGGSAGAPYLRSRLDLRFFPELWELRTRL